MALFEQRGYRQQRWSLAVARLLDWPISAFYAERGRWFLWAPVLFGLGIAAYFRLSTDPSALWCIIVTAQVLFAHVAARVAHAPLAVITGATLVVTLGFSSAKLRTEYVAAPVLPVAISKAVVTGRIAGIEGRARGGRRLLLDVTMIEGLPTALTPARIVVYQQKPTEDLSIGDNIRLTADLRPPSRPARPGGFDFARQNYFDRIGAVAFTARPIEADKSETSSVSLSSMDRLILGLSEFRRRIGERIERALPAEVGGIAKALMTGERGGIGEATNDAYRDAGIFHILSIAGLHMAIMGGSVFFALRFVLAGLPSIALRWPIKKWAALAAGLAAFGYLLISGGAHATIRSFIMIFIMFLAIIAGRPALAMRNVALAALVILVVTPESLFDAGFQLSFAAVTALVAGYEAYRLRTYRLRRQGAGIVSQTSGPLRWLRSLWLFFAATVATTLLAGFATAPIAAYHFHQAQTFAVATNLIAVPLSNLVVMPAALAAFLMMPFSMEAYPLAIMQLGINGMTAAAQWVAGWQGPVVAVPAFSETALIVMLAGGLWLCLWARPWRWMGVPVMLLGTGLAANVDRPTVLIGEEGRLVGVRGSDGLSAVDAPATTFALKRWLAADGDTRTPDEVRKRSAFTCDLNGCIARVAGQVIAVPRSPAALPDGCRRADIIILSFPQPAGCAGSAQIIDRRYLVREGPLALFMKPGDRARILSVEDYRGARPWSYAGQQTARQAYWHHRYRNSLPPPADAKPTPTTTPSPALPDPMDPEWEDGYPLYWGRGR